MAWEYGPKAAGAFSVWTASFILVSLEIPKEAKGFDRTEEADDRHKVVPATDAKPIPTANGPRVRSAPISAAGTWKDLATPHHAILFSLLTISRKAICRLCFCWGGGIVVQIRSIKWGEED